MVSQPIGVISVEGLLMAFLALATIVVVGAVREYLRITKRLESLAGQFGLGEDICAYKWCWRDPEDPVHSDPDLSPVPGSHRFKPARVVVLTTDQILEEINR
jgi:hypothetical protein